MCSSYPGFKVMEIGDGTMEWKNERTFEWNCECEVKLKSKAIGDNLDNILVYNFILGHYSTLYVFKLLFDILIR